MKNPYQHPDHEPFMRAICQAPLDDAPKLVYADWLDENDDDHAVCWVCFDSSLNDTFQHFVGVDANVCELCHNKRRLPNRYARRAAYIRQSLAEGYRDVWSSFDDEDFLSDLWFGPFYRKLPQSTLHGHIGYRSGFVSYIQILPTLWQQLGPILVALQPLREVRLLYVSLYNVRAGKRRGWAFYNPDPRPDAAFLTFRNQQAALQPILQVLPRVGFDLAKKQLYKGVCVFNTEEAAWQSLSNAALYVAREQLGWKPTL